MRRCSTIAHVKESHGLRQTIGILEIKQEEYQYKKKQKKQRDFV